MKCSLTSSTELPVHRRTILTKIDWEFCQSHAFICENVEKVGFAVHRTLIVSRRILPDSTYERARKKCKTLWIIKTKSSIFDWKAEMFTSN